MKTTKWKKTNKQKFSHEPSPVPSLDDLLEEGELGKDWSEKILSQREIQQPENTKTRRILRFLFEILVTLVFAAVVAIALFQSVTMQESAMEPTLSVGDRFLMNRAAYLMSQPERGDIIVFKTNASDDAALHIRRVIGLPGETIQIADGRIYINGELYVENRDFPAMSYSGAAENSITLENGEYFVLGDNRNNSEDSRHGDIGVVNKRYVVGKLWFTIVPLKEIGFLKG